jgi:predicted ferric reductase
VPIERAFAVTRRQDLPVQLRGVVAAWLAWALAIVALGLPFLMDARGWRNAQILDGGWWGGVDLHYRLERWMSLIAFLIGSVCVLVTVMFVRTIVRARFAAASAVSLVAFVVASGLALVAVQSTPGQFLPPTDTGL